MLSTCRANERRLGFNGGLVSSSIVTLDYLGGYEAEVGTYSIVSWIVLATFVHFFPSFVGDLVADTELPQDHEFPC